VIDWEAPAVPRRADVKDGLQGAIDEAIEAVVRWEWQPIDMEWESPRPFSAIRLGKSPPRPRRGWTPRDLTKGVKYGWDERDRLRVAQRFTTWGPDEVILWSQNILTFAFSESGDHLRVNCDRRPDGSARRDLLTIIHRIVDDGRLTGLLTSSADNGRSPLWVREEFDFDADGNVCGVTAYRNLGAQHPDVRFGAPERDIVRFEATLDDLGALVRLERQERSETGAAVSDLQLLWQRTSADELRAAEETIDARLRPAVEEWVARVGPDSPAYCLAILYSDSWSPSLGIGTVEDLERWGRDRLDSMWNPAEFPCFDPEPTELNTPVLAEAIRVTAQQWGSATPDKIRAKCLTIAAELKDKQLDLARADNFIVYATDLELVDLDANLRKLGQTRARRAIEK
jgi:hypothetical protein